MLKKVIEFPLFHVGTFTSQNGTPVPFTESLLRQVEKNTNFILKSKVLQAPIGYDHPAAKSDAHGTLVGVRYDNGVLYAQGDNWSDTLVADAKAMKKLAYSGELAENFSYPDGKGKTVAVGPAVVGMAILGSSRPAIKNLKPLSEFEFAEGTAPADAFMTREELRSAGLVSQHVDGQHYFGEVENDERRFFSETDRQEHTMTDEQIQAAIAAGVKANLDTAVSTAVAAAVAPLQQQIKSFSETAKREAEVHSFCEKVAKVKPTLNPLSLERLEKKILLHPDMTAALDAEIRSFVEGLSAVIVQGGREREGSGGGAGEGDGDITEPKALASVRVKHFADRSKNDVLLSEALADLEKIKPKMFSEAKAGTVDQRLAVLRQYVVEREAEAN